MFLYRFFLEKQGECFHISLDIRISITITISIVLSSRYQRDTNCIFLI